MKKITMIFAALVVATSFSFGQTELFYDNDTYTGWQSFVPERIFAVHMSPTGPCEVLLLKYYVEKQGLSEGIFITSIHNWDGSQPAVNAVYEQATAVITEGWKEQNVEGDAITFDGDFVVGYKPMDQAAYLAYDADLNTGRNWILDITNSDWSEVTNHSFLIRAVVEYTTGEIEELEGTPISIYPNPATNVLNIEAGKDVQKVTLFNLAGQMVFTEQMQTGKTSIDLNGLMKGLYFVRIESMEGTNTQKLIIQ